MGRTDAQVIALGEPTFGTVYNADDPKRSPPNTLAVGNNIKIEDGNLRGFPAPALLPDFAAATSTAPAMFYVEGIGWQYAADHVSLCHDSVCPWAPSNRRFSYRATETAGQLVASDGNGAQRRLGTPPPTITSLVAGGGALRMVRVCIVPRMGDLDRGTWGVAQSDFYRHPGTGEGNPSQSNGGFGTAPATNNPWLEIPAWDGAVIGIGAINAVPTELPLVDATGEFEIRVYARPIGALSGPAKLIMRQGGWTGTVNTTVTISTANEATWGTDLILSWDVGGGPDNPIYKYDFSPAPTDLCIISDEVHTVAATGGGTSALVPPSAGMLVGMTRSGQLCWSQLGYPWRWPLYARQRLEGKPLGAVTSQATTYLSTAQAWYVLSGTQDTSMSLTRAEAEHCTADKFGASVAMTPKGVLFCTELGVAAFDGARTTLLHRLVHPYTSTVFCYIQLGSPWVGWHGLYHEGYYIADIGAAASVVLDLTQEGMPASFLANDTTVAFPNIGGYTVRRLHASKVYRGPLGDQGVPSLWATLGVDAGPLTSLPTDRPHSWRPRLDQSQLNNTSRWLPWQATSQQLRAGIVGLRKKWRRLEQRVFNLPATPAATFTAVAGRGDSPVSVLGPINLADGLCQVPFGFDWADWVQFYWAAGIDPASDSLMASNKQVDSLILRGEQYAAR